MARKETEEKEDVSLEFIQSCKKDILKFGINNFDKFLVSVKALKPDLKTVLQYRNTQMDTYYSLFLKQHEKFLSDKFVLDKFKIFTSDSDGKRHETGWFVPRAFWDWVLDYKSVAAM